MASHRAHWPASQYEIDGYNLAGNHRPSHGNIGSIKSKVDSLHNPNTFTVLIGIAPGNSNYATEHGLSWLNPGKIETRTNSVIYSGYDAGQRAYRLKITKQEAPVRLELIPQSHKLKNPVLICEGIKPGSIKDIKMNGKKLQSAEYQTGMTYENDYIIYIDKIIGKKTKTRNNFQMMGKLNGKVAFVTGTSQGIGAAIASELIEAGCNICMHYFHSAKEPERLQEIARKERANRNLCPGGFNN